jgi:hypothetical protein
MGLLVVVFSMVFRSTLLVPVGGEHLGVIHRTTGSHNPFFVSYFCFIFLFHIFLFHFIKFVSYETNETKSNFLFHMKQNIYSCLNCFIRNKKEMKHFWNHDRSFSEKYYRQNLPKPFSMEASICCQRLSPTGDYVSDKTFCRVTKICDWQYVIRTNFKIHLL